MTLPSTSAADADLAPVWWRSIFRQALKRQLALAGTVALGVVVTGAAVSMVLAKVGFVQCDGERTCTKTFLYPLSAQPRLQLTTTDGLPSYRREWHPTGRVWFEGATNGEGQRTGAWRELYPDGTLRFEGTYANDQIVGKETWYYASGAREWEISRADGDRDGEERWWHESGHLRRIGAWKDGQRHGTFTVYNDDESVAFSGQYRFGVNVAGARVD